ncbi:MAG: hypothetical protein EXS64_01800 [Candidatus Latescibacteria bacterium]|nr:hypothetical protein [Candidatus Latescibacterota bacterium]
METSDRDARREDSGRRLPVHRGIAQMVEVASAIPQGPDWLHSQIQRIREVTVHPPSTLMRRVFLCWFRIYVYRKGAKQEGVDIRIPIPIPIIAAFFRRHLTWNQAAKVAALAQQEVDGYGAVEGYAKSCMALEFLRVEKNDPGKRKLVVIGID